MPVSRTPKPGRPNPGCPKWNYLEGPTGGGGGGRWSAPGTQGGRCSLRLDSQPQGLDVCKCWGHQARDNRGLNPPQAREGETPRSHPSPLLKPQNGDLPAQGQTLQSVQPWRELGQRRRLGGNSTGVLAQPGAGWLQENILVFLFLGANRIKPWWHVQLSRSD